MKFLISIFLFLQSSFAYSNTKNKFMLDDIIPNDMCLMVIVEGEPGIFCPLGRNNFVHQYQYINGHPECATGHCFFLESIKEIMFVTPYEIGNSSKESVVGGILKSAIEKGFEYVHPSIADHYNGEIIADMQVTNEIKNNHQNQYDKLKLEQMQNCTQELNNLSSKSLIVQNEIYQTNSMCFSFKTDDQLRTCIYLQKNLINQIKNLVQSIENSEESCLAWIQAHSSMDSLKNNFNKLKAQYTAFLQDVSSYQNMYGMLSYQQCNSDVRSKFLNMSILADRIISDEFAGNMYLFNWALSALPVLKDYITTQAEICTVDGVQDSLVDRNFVESIQGTAIEAQDIFNEIFLKFTNKDLILGSEKWCKLLQRESNINLTLCEEPLHNPSWAYSVHYQVKQIQNGTK